MNISFRLKPGRDDLIIDWLRCIGYRDRTYYIKEALKLYINRGGSNHSILLPPTSPFKSRNIVRENLQPADPEPKEDEKHNGVDLDAALDVW